jgi:general secretion pathway protein A
MQGDQLLVGSGPAQMVVSRDEIEARWYGDYFVAWPQAPDWPREIGLGDTGEPVERIVQLARRAPAAYDGPPAFDAGFERWLVDFQVRNGLEADGIVGPKTLLYLMRHSIEEPRLVMTLEGEN